MRDSLDLQTTNSSCVYRRLKRGRDLGCSICPPHGGENAKRVPKHKVKKAYELNPKRRHR